MKFEKFFQIIHGHQPFHWQSRLAEEVLAEGWHDQIDAPTGSGKTASIDVAVYAMYAAASGVSTQAVPRRVFYVVDRRIVVDATYARAAKIASVIDNDSRLAKVNFALRKWGGVAEKGSPLLATIMRGGMYRDHSWINSPTQPMLCVSTVDQFGSRLLFRGYGVTPKMAPIHAALVACDALLMVDEAHLSHAFLETIRQTIDFAKLGCNKEAVFQPLQLVELSATLASGSASDSAMEAPRKFSLNDSERNEAQIKERLSVSKLARLAQPIKVDEIEPMRLFVDAAVQAVESYLDPENCPRRLLGSKPVPPVIGVIVNRVQTARDIYSRLSARSNDPRGNLEEIDCLLLTGRIRPYDRDRLLFRSRDEDSDRLGWLPMLETGRHVAPMKPIVVVATQTLEVGADLDFDALVTQVASIDALRQRFGRLNRVAARKDKDAKHLPTHATILATKDDIASRTDDPVYGSAMAGAWKFLNQHASGKGRTKTSDFGITAFDCFLERDREGYDGGTVAHPETATLLPGYLDLLSQTNQAPEPSPDVSVFLHGAVNKVKDVNVVWRCDMPIDHYGQIDSSESEACIATVAAVPPSSLEACSVPLHKVRQWLEIGDISESTVNDDSDIADVEGVDSTDEPGRKTKPRYRRILRWCGPQSRQTKIVTGSSLRPGDTIVVPSQYGGYDEFGWNIQSRDPVADIADQAACVGRAKPTLRIHPKVIANHFPQFDKLPAARRDELLQPSEAVAWMATQAADDALVTIIAKSFRDHPGSYRVFGKPPTSSELRNSKLPAVTLVARRRLLKEQVLDLLRPISSAVTMTELNIPMEEGDAFLSAHSVIDAMGGISLEDHVRGVAQKLDQYLANLSLPAELEHCLRVAAQWHDAGKVDPRFQLWMFGGDEIQRAMYPDCLLAKSLIPSSNRAAMRNAQIKSGTPVGFRHEELSVLLFDQMINAQPDQGGFGTESLQLTRHLMGTHHGFGRSLYHPVIDNTPPDIDYANEWCEVALSGEQRAERRLRRLSAAWADNFWSVTRRFGWWQLAMLETLLRIADQQQSADEANQVEQSKIKEAVQ